MPSTAKILALTALLLASIIAPPALAIEQEQPASNPPADESSQYSTEKTVNTIKLYTIEKKDEALQKAKEAMDNIDARIDKLEQRIKEKKSEWSEKIAKKREEELAELKKTREEVVSRYQKLKEASKKTWEAAKDAFIRSYHRLTHKLDKVNSDTLASREEPNDNASQDPSASH